MRQDRLTHSISLDQLTSLLASGRSGMKRGFVTSVPCQYPSEKPAHAGKDELLVSFSTTKIARVLVKRIKFNVLFTNAARHIQNGLKIR